MFRGLPSTGNWPPGLNLMLTAITTACAIKPGFLQSPADISQKDEQVLAMKAGNALVCP